MDSPRPFTNDDYPALDALLTETFPDYPGWAEELRYEDEHRAPHCRAARWVVEGDDQLLACADYTQYADMYHPDTYTLNVVVRGAERRRGLGQALYEHLLGALAPLAPTTLLAEVRETERDALGFVQRRGFVETMREWESHLPVADFDPTPFAAELGAVAARGIRIVSLSALAADPERDRKLHALCSELEADVPTPEPATPVDFDHWLTTTLHNPRFLHDGHFIALDGDEYVGWSGLWAIEGSPDLDTGLTGVRQAYRRQGIALALKLAAIAYARSSGAPRIKTWNATTNTGMLAINTRLGFVRQPAWIFLTKLLSPAAHEPVKGDADAP